MLHGLAHSEPHTLQKQKSERPKPFALRFLWSGRRDSNPRPSAPKADALPGCATPRLFPMIVTRSAGNCVQMPPLGCNPNLCYNWNRLMAAVVQWQNA